MVTLRAVNCEREIIADSMLGSGPHNGCSHCGFGNNVAVHNCELDPRTTKKDIGGMVSTCSKFQQFPRVNFISGVKCPPRERTPFNRLDVFLVCVCVCVCVWSIFCPLLPFNYKQINVLDPHSLFVD